MSDLYIEKPCIEETVAYLKKWVKEGCYTDTIINRQRVRWAVVDLIEAYLELKQASEMDRADPVGAEPVGAQPPARFPE